MVAVFTKEELEIFKRSQLKRLADYYGLRYKTNIKKQDLIDALYAYVCEPDIMENGVNMSVRVRRIYELERAKEWKT